MSSILRHKSHSISFGAGVLVAAVGGLLIAYFTAPSVSAPRAGTTAVEATVNPSTLMVHAPRDLPVEQYDSH